jgi:hypothetical protein
MNQTGDFRYLHPRYTRRPPILFRAILISQSAISRPAFLEVTFFDFKIRGISKIGSIPSDRMGWASGYSRFRSGQGGAVEPEIENMAVSPIWEHAQAEPEPAGAAI